MNNIKLPVEYFKGNGITAQKAQISRQRIIEIIKEAIEADRQARNCGQCVPLSTDDKSVFIDGIGEVPLDFGGQENQITGETSDGYHTFNELYAHRVRLFCLLMHAHKSNAWWSRKHHDGSVWEGWVIAGINTPEGSVTYHLPDSEIENLPESIELPKGKKWDGHTSDDVLVRLLSLRQARNEPVLYQSRIRPIWAGASKTWTDWENCTKDQANDYKRVKVLHDWEYEVRELYTTPQLQQIPEGYALVPIEPTPEMLKSGWAENDVPLSVRWKAMINAAPKA